MAQIEGPPLMRNVMARLCAAATRPVGAVAGRSDVALTKGAGAGVGTAGLWSGSSTEPSGDPSDTG